MNKAKQIIKHLLKRISETRVADSAAAIAYYAILSFFPLILFIIAFNSSFLQSSEIQSQIFRFVAEYLPSSEPLVAANLQHMAEASNAVGIIGTFMLLWSATLVFAGFAQNINMAWTSAPSRHFLVERLIGLMIIGFLVILMILSLIFTTMLDLLPRLYPMQLQKLFASMTSFNHLVISYLPLLAISFLLLLLYKYIPNAEVLWRESILGVVFAMSALQLTKHVFLWYLSFGTESYNLVYGSLGAVVALMLWIYLSSIIILVGAHICAAAAVFFRGSKSEEFPDKQAVFASPIIEKASPMQPEGKGDDFSAAR